MTISDIQHGKGNKFHVYVDGKYLLTIHAQVYAQSSVSIGDEVDGEDLDSLLEQSQELFAKEKAMDLLSRRSYSAKQLHDKLAPYSDSDTAWAVVERMEEIGLINDEDYARRLAADLTNLKKYGPARVRQELQRRGIDRDLARETVDDLEADPRDMLVQLIERKYASYLEDDETGKGKRRTVNALLRLGYSYEDIRAALRDYQEGLDEDGWDE